MCNFPKYNAKTNAKIRFQWGSLASFSRKIRGLPPQFSLCTAGGDQKIKKSEDVNDILKAIQKVFVFAEELPDEDSREHKSIQSSKVFAVERKNGDTIPVEVNEEHEPLALQDPIIQVTDLVK